MTGTTNGASGGSNGPHRNTAGDDAPLGEREQALMAYIDDELSPNQRREFELRLQSDVELAREASEFKNLVDVSRSMALTEPTDVEVRRFWARFYNRSEWRLGWVLLILGTIAVVAELVYLLMSSDALSWTIKIGVLFALIGGGMLVFNAARLKMRTSHFDRYRGVMR